MTSPVDGLKTGVVAPLGGVRHSPPMKEGQGRRMEVMQRKSSKHQDPSSRE
jgi:hypothetical protein